jgi:hypothetical protein
MPKNLGLLKRAKLGQKNPALKDQSEYKKESLSHE